MDRAMVRKPHIRPRSGVTHGPAVFFKASNRGLRGLVGRCTGSRSEVKSGEMARFPAASRDLTPAVLRVVDRP